MVPFRIKGNGGKRGEVGYIESCDQGGEPSEGAQEDYSPLTRTAGSKKEKCGPSDSRGGRKS